MHYTHGLSGYSTCFLFPVPLVILSYLLRIISPPLPISSIHLLWIILTVFSVIFPLILSHCLNCFFCHILTPIFRSSYSLLFIVHLFTYIILFFPLIYNENISCIDIINSIATISCNSCKLWFM